MSLVFLLCEVCTCGVDVPGVPDVLGVLGVCRVCWVCVVCVDAWFVLGVLGVCLHAWCANSVLVCLVSASASCAWCLPDVLGSPPEERHAGRSCSSELC